MATLWLGDFRLRQLQNLFDKSEKETDSKYFSEVDAEFTWFSGIATAQLIKMYTPDTDVVIMTGFNDCVHSFIWNGFNIENIALNYATKINELIEDYPDMAFYV